MRMTKTREMRNKLMGMMPLEYHGTFQPIIDSLIKSAVNDGEQSGREQAATMIEQLLLGDENFDYDAIVELKNTLRQK